MRTIIILAILCIVIVSCGPTCGNKELEEGENSKNCCLDAGCPGEQKCQNNVCKDPTCGDCEYLEEHKCVKYKCCEKADCSEDEECADHKCSRITCGECEYLDERECKKLVCCDDSDCDDNDPDTVDLCKFPGTKSAECTHEDKDECSTDSDCNDNDASTMDTCSTGTPRVCRNYEITKCTNNDGFCPDGCTYKNDDDCEIETIECDENDIGCFYDALKDCLIADLTWTTEDYNSTHEIDVTTLLSIVGEDNGDCEVEFKTKKVELKFTDDYIDDLKDDYNYTTAEVNDLEEEAQDDADEVEGYKWTCTFEDYDDLLDILNDWRDGDYSVTVFENYDCDGDYFD